MCVCVCVSVRARMYTDLQMQDFLALKLIDSVTHSHMLVLWSLSNFSCVIEILFSVPMALGVYVLNEDSWMYVSKTF